LRRRQPDWTLRLWARSGESARRAREIFPNVTRDATEAAHGADLCVLCTPIGAMPALAKILAAALADHAAVTDAGSVKGSVVRRLEPLLGGRFVGSHPMAGSEQHGLAAAREDLFDGAACILTPTPVSTPATLAAVRNLWQIAGCRLLEMTPDQHDETVARVSHLPHAVAAALVRAISLRVPDPGRAAGNGYRDTTRIAGGPPAMWSEILLENRAALLAGLEDFTTMVGELKTLIEQGDAPALEKYLALSRAAREAAR
jgi:prephenate dehydrogenase